MAALVQPSLCSSLRRINRLIVLIPKWPPLRDDQLPKDNNFRIHWCRRSSSILLFQAAPRTFAFTFWWDLVTLSVFCAVINTKRFLIFTRPNKRQSSSTHMTNNNWSRLLQGHFEWAISALFDTSSKLTKDNLHHYWDMLRNNPCSNTADLVCMTRLIILESTLI